MALNIANLVSSKSRGEIIESLRIITRWNIPDNINVDESKRLLTLAIAAYLTADPIMENTDDARTVLAKYHPTCSLRDIMLAGITLVNSLEKREWPTPRANYDKDGGDWTVHLLGPSLEGEYQGENTVKILSEDFQASVKSQVAAWLCDLFEVNNIHDHDIELDLPFKFTVPGNVSLRSLQQMKSFLIARMVNDHLPFANKAFAIDKRSREVLADNLRLGDQLVLAEKKKLALKEKLRKLKRLVKESNKPVLTTNAIIPSTKDEDEEYDEDDEEVSASKTKAKDTRKSEASYSVPVAVQILLRILLEKGREHIAALVKISPNDFEVYLASGQFDLDYNIHQVSSAFGDLLSRSSNIQRIANKRAHSATHTAIVWAIQFRERSTLYPFLKWLYDYVAQAHGWPPFDVVNESLL